jgi:CubicO group peptidase (beta-lactamase class C family)
MPINVEPRYPPSFVSSVGMATRRWSRILLRAVLGMVLVAGLLYGAAFFLTPYSGLARAIVWMDADVEDHRRFPSRTIQAPREASRLGRGVVPPELRSVNVGGRRRDLETFLDSTGTTAFIVLRGDAVVYESYFNGDDRSSVQTSFSVAKSFLSTLVGIAIEEGHIRGVDDPITRYVPELADRDLRFDRITIGHLLSMTSGLRYEEQGLPWSDDAQTYYGADLRNLALEDTEILESPGRRWLYNNFNPLLVGMALERATRMPVAEYLERTLWMPLGAEYVASWSLDSERGGFEKMESGLNARAIDFARFGALYLHRGRWNDRRIVPPEWVAASTSPSDVAPHYGLWWWVEPNGAFSARGHHGQFLYVDPARALVFARFGMMDGGAPWPDVFADLASRLGS